METGKGSLILTIRGVIHKKMVLYNGIINRTLS